MGRKYMGSGFGGRKSLIRMIADKITDDLERQVLERKNEQRQAADSIRYGAQSKTGYTKVPKKPKSLLELTLVDNDTMILIDDINDIIPE